jgi:peptide-methionine (S)-S-oxide reductase
MITAAQRWHQQYLAKNAAGYCPDHATGVSRPVGMFAKGSAGEV